MLHKTNGIVLRSIKYGDSSLVVTIFTALFGIQAYMVKGVRSTKTKQNRGGFFQPGMLLEMVVYQLPNKNMQRIQEYKAAHIYTTLQEDIVKSSISLFSVELLFRLLPEQAPLPPLFGQAFGYFVALDNMSLRQVANFPLYLIIQCSKELGYDLRYAAQVSQHHAMVNDEDDMMLGRLLMVEDLASLEQIEMNADMRLRLIDKYVAYLQQHTQHMGSMRSLSVLRAILH